MRVIALFDRGKKCVDIDMENGCHKSPAKREKAKISVLLYISKTPACQVRRIEQKPMHHYNFG
jgi:hypothetical protein